MFRFAQHDSAICEMISRKTNSPRFGVGSLLDLFETGISVADPVACFVDLSRIHRNGARNFFASRHQRALILHGFAAFDWELPVMREFENRVEHGLSLNDVDAAAT